MAVSCVRRQRPDPRVGGHAVESSGRCPRCIERDAARDEPLTLIGARGHHDASRVSRTASSVTVSGGRHNQPLSRKLTYRASPMTMWSSTSTPINVPASASRRVSAMRDAPSRRLQSMHNAISHQASHTRRAPAHAADPLRQEQIVHRRFHCLEDLLFRAVVVTSYALVCLLLLTRERVSRGSQCARTLWAGKADRLRDWLHG